jgi:lactoylglutathione lyase
MFSTAFPIVTTPDLPGLLAFYTGLGCAETYRFPADGEPVFVTLRLGDSELGLGAGPDVRWELCVYVDDCDAAVRRLAASGATVVEEPADQPWGERSARVIDPGGNRLLVLSRR